MAPRNKTSSPLLLSDDVLRGTCVIIALLSSHPTAINVYVFLCIYNFLTATCAFLPDELGKYRQNN